MRNFWTITLIALSVMAAGCLTNEKTATTPDPSGSSMPLADGSAVAGAWSTCEQWHLHFNARAEDFQPDAPPGFTVQADDQGLTTFLIHVTLCDGHSEALLAVPVIPPAEYEDANRTEIAVLQVFHDEQAATLYPTPFSSRLVAAKFDRSDTPLGPTLTITGGGETFTLTLTLAASSGTFPGENWARFAHDGDALGVLTADGNESISVGFGPVAYTHQGPGGAPPVTGGIAHVVKNLDITFRKEIIQ